MEPGDNEHPDLEMTRLDGSAQAVSTSSRLTRWTRTRTGRATLTAVCVLLVAGALAGLTIRATPDPAGAFGAALGMPTATATEPILPTGDRFIIANTVPWGTLTVDGRHPTLTDFTDLGTGFTLRRGAHHLVYQAQGFPTLRCVISVPASTRDTCPKATNVPEAISAMFERFLDLQATPDHLLAPAYQSLVAAVETQLATTTATTTITPGERYYSQSGRLTIAQASMTFTMGVEATKAAMGDCLMEICELGDGVSAPFGWQLETLVMPTWRVTGPNGVSFTSAIPQSQRFPVSIDFHAAPVGSDWQAQVDGQNPLADVVNSTASAALESVWGPIGADAGLDPGRLANAADGAVLQVISGGAAFPPADATLTPILVVHAEVLWRFGVLLAVNSDARRRFPHLPVASAAEQTLARSAIFLRS